MGLQFYGLLTSEATAFIAMTWHSLWYTHVVQYLCSCSWEISDPTGAGELEEMTSRGPYQPQPVCDSLIYQ